MCSLSRNVLLALLSHSPIARLRDLAGMAFIYLKYDVWIYFMLYDLKYVAGFMLYAVRLLKDAAWIQQYPEQITYRMLLGDVYI